MLSVKQLFITLCVFLLIMSIYHDLSKDFSPINDNPINNFETSIDNYTVVQVEVMPGDTLLSISEQLNTQAFMEMDVAQLLEDFTTLNPSVDPQQLIIGKMYYFPKYHL